MDRTLYLFKLDTETLEIRRIEITTYERGKWGNGKSFYRHKILSTTYYCYDSDIDRVKNWRIYTFDGDYNRAREMFIEFISEKQRQAQAEADRFKEFVEKV